MSQIIVLSGLAGFAFRTSTSNSGSTQITIPSTAQENDVAVFFDRAGANFGSPPSKVTPSGWTTIPELDQTNASPNPMRLACSYKKLSASDPNTAITGMSDSIMTKFMLVFRPTAGVFNGVTIGDPDSQITDGNPTAQTLTAGSGTPPLIVIGIGTIYSGSQGGFTTASPAFDDTPISTGSTIIGYKIYNGAPSNHSIDVGDVGDGNYLATFYIAGF